MKEFFFNTIQEFNDFIGVKTLHPLVSVARVEKASPIEVAVHHYGLYALFLKENKGCKLSYGRTENSTDSRAHPNGGVCHRCAGDSPWYSHPHSCQRKALARCCKRQLVCSPRL